MRYTFWDGSVSTNLGEVSIGNLEEKAEKKVSEKFNYRNESTREEFYDFLYDFLIEENYLEEKKDNKEELYKQVSPLGMKLESEMTLDSYDTIYGSKEYLVPEGRKLSREAAHEAALYENAERDFVNWVGENTETSVSGTALSMGIENYLEGRASLPEDINENQKRLLKFQVSHDISKSTEVEKDTNSNYNLF